MVPFVTFRSPYAAVSIALALRIWIPITANALWFPLSPILGTGFHVGSVVLIMSSLTQGLHHRDRLGTIFLGLHGRIAALLALMLYGGLLTAAASMTALSSFVSTVVTPVVTCFLVVLSNAQHRNSRQIITRVLIWMAASQALLGILQFYTESGLLWSSERCHYQQAVIHPGYTRIYGTMDNSIEYGFFMATAIVLTLSIRRFAVRVSLIALFLVAALLTESRAAAVAALAATMFVLLRGRGSPLIRLLQAFFVIPTALVVVALAGDNLFARSQALDISHDARVTAWHYFASVVGDHLIFGDGHNQTAIKGTVLASSLENGYFIWILDFSVAAIGIYLLIQLSLLTSDFHRRGYYWMCAVLLIGGAWTFSSFANPTAYGLLLWSFIGLGLCADDGDGLLACDPGLADGFSSRGLRDGPGQSGKRPRP